MSSKRKMSIGYIAPKSKKTKKAARKQTLWSRVPRSPFPDRALTKLRYVDRIDMEQQTLGIRARWLFSCNNVFDPNFTSIGHQPMGYDQYAELYNHYNVKQSHIKVTFAPPNNQNDNDTDGIVCCISLNNDAGTDVRSDTALLEDKSTTFALVHGRDGSKTLSKFYNEKFRFPNDKYQTTHAQTNTGPTEQTFYDLNIMDTGNSLGRYKVLVEIEYMVEFYERKDLQGS